MPNFPTQLPNVLGTFDSRDLDAPIISVPAERTFDGIQQLLALYNGLLLQTIDLFADYTLIAKETYEFASPANEGGLLQPVGEYAPSLLTQSAISATAGAFEVGYPIFRRGTGAGFTPEFLQRSTLDKLNRHVYEALLKDYNTQVRYLLAALFRNTNYTFKDDKVIGQGLGTYSVKRLLNADGDGERAYINGTLTDLGAKNHYKTSGTSGWTNGVFTMIKQTLSDVALDNDIVIMVSKASAEAIAQNCSNFVPASLPEDDKYIVPNGFNALSVNNQNAYTPPVRAIVSAPNAVGRVRDVGEIIVIPFLPDNYAVALDRSADKPLAIRECDLAALRGFRLTADDGLVPQLGGNKSLLAKRWERIFGVGVRNRANGVVVQITTNGSYTAPNFMGVSDQS